MAKTLERHDVETWPREILEERPPELLIEPPVPDAPPLVKEVAAPKRAGRWIRWMVAIVVLAMVASFAFIALRDGGTDTTVENHPLTEVYIA